MLIQVIAFELKNEQFEIENTVENQEKVFRNRFTRNIHFVNELDVAWPKKERIPVSFYDIPDTIDEIDEMVGTF